MLPSYPIWQASNGSMMPKQDLRLGSQKASRSFFGAESGHGTAFRTNENLREIKRYAHRLLLTFTAKMFIAYGYALS